MKEKVILALLKTGLSREQIEKLIEVPKDSSLGDFAFPCFILASSMKKSPVQIASDMAPILDSSHFEKINASGPYINFFVKKEEIAKDIISKILKEKNKYGSLNIHEKAVIEFPSPNTNKPLHIGHARNIILGQSITNILRKAGNTVITTNLNNDRGVHICKSMLAYDLFGEKDSPKISNKKSDHFVGDYYVKFAKEAQENPELEEKAQEYLRLWENKDKRILSLWKKMNSWAFEGFKETYQKFNLKFDKEYFESDTYQGGKEIVEEALKKGIAYKKEDGAIAIDLKDEGLGEKVILRADGTSIYITQDLNLAYIKEKEFHMDKSIIVSATEQLYHFKVLFSILKRLGKTWAEKSTHLSYGMVNLESGRMKSREGNVVDTDELIEELEKMAKEEISKREKLSKQELDKRAKAIALAALRYYFLKIDRNKDMVFKPEESISFEGNTGPYLLYTFARAHSILAKKKAPKKFDIPTLTDLDKNLIVQLGEFPNVVAKSYSQMTPSIIANYTHSLAQSFNEWYHNSQVIGSKEQSFRLNLVHAVTIVLDSALELLNIQPLKRM